MQIKQQVVAADIQAIQKFIVEQAFKGRIIVTVGDCGPVIGMTRQSARNLYNKGKFPFPTFPLNGVRRVLVSDIVAILTRIKVDPAQPGSIATEHKRGRGRPRLNGLEGGAR